MDIVGHFGLAQDPFRATIEPAQAYQSRPFTTARQQVLAGLARGARLIAVAGGTGSGKTLLLRDLDRALAGRYRVIRPQQPGTMQAALSTPAELLLVDDADAIDDTTFATLIGRATMSGGPAVVLAGVQRCLDRLPAPLGALTVPLPFLESDEAMAFLADRITRAGGSAALFDAAALEILAEAGRGIPAALRMLGANALFQAAFDGASHVEERHAMQAAAMAQDMWRGATAPQAASPSPAPVAEPPAVERPPAMPPVAPALAAAPVTVGPTGEATIDEAPVVPRRSWWRNAPPLVRMAMVVGLLLLSLPVIGYVVGAVKDDRPATESSYLPDGGGMAAAKDEPSAETAVAAVNPDVRVVPPTSAAVPPESRPVEAAGPPRDLTAGIGDSAPEPEVIESDAPVETAEVPPEPQPATPVDEAADSAPAVEAPANVAPASGGPRVFIHYSTAQPGADAAAAEVARQLRDRGFTIADIRAVPNQIETASVRYFFADDRAQAEALQDALGAVLRPRGFSGGDLKSMTGYRPSPRRGTLEVWVPAG